MNYDTTISNEVSLSKVLDEMIVDGSDFDLIVQFLKSHESSIKDIYANSAFVYELYDLILHPYRIDGFLVSHIVDLPAPYRYYYLASHMIFGLDNLDSKYNFRYFKDLFKNIPFDYDVPGNNFVKKISGYRRDRSFLLGEDDLIEYLNGLSAKNDMEYMKQFIRNSYLVANVFTAKMFSRLNVNTRFLILVIIRNQFKEEFLGGRQFGYSSFSIDDCDYAMMGLVSILLKQLVYFNAIDEFNWIVNVLEISEIPSAREVIGKMTMLKLPENIRHTINTDAEFSEVVFDMNLVETQFDVLDLFLYIYIANPRLRGQMMEAIDLVDFFNLGFEWKELEFIKNAVV